jgi:hypothetical protein
MFALNNVDLLTIFLITSAIIMAAAEMGRRLGVRVGAGSGDNVSTLEGAILGLLALMIGFTFAMALARFDGRREAVLNEANAIGTTALRARLLPAPYNTEALKIIRDYVQIRLDMTRHSPSPAQIDAATDRSNALQEQLWQQAKTLAAKDNAMVPTGLYIQALNDMIDNQEKRLTQSRNRVPGIVLLALYAVATVASAFTGYTSGIEARRTRLPIYVTGMLISAVILLILDLDRPSTGFIKVSQQPIIDTAKSIAGYTD